MTTVAAEGVLHSARLRLRPPVEADARAIARLAGSWAVARQTESLPHPYGLDQAKAWIANGRYGRESRFVLIREDEAVVGVVELFVRFEDWEIGFWLGKPFWNQGYATEAVRTVSAHAFDERGVAKLTAAVLGKNRAACRVLAKVGFTFLGTRSELLPQRGGYKSLGWYVLDRAGLVPT